ncbi:hypothetical protein K432DRAFT_377996 [Lepidopterella palustris CBS 459.81]|uniref:Uncharacterized protein n=1 Tax=Lepidopterella palustris CBS 459.81 TaxID=1314670 RepID=A0A8E2JJR5_9PEZI|nr:hypothetical protein K432DRAFT_377996 [Lepidopterella palustris CBS 459.81]
MYLCRSACGFDKNSTSNPALNLCPCWGIVDPKRGSRCLARTDSKHGRSNFTPFFQPLHKSSLSSPRSLSVLSFAQLPLGLCEERWLVVQKGNTTVTYRLKRHDAKIEHLETPIKPFYVARHARLCGHWQACPIQNSLSWFHFLIALSFEIL